MSHAAPQSERRASPGSPRHALLAGLAFGLLIYLAFAPLSLWPLALGAAAVLVFSAGRAGDRPLRFAAAFGLGTLPCWLAEQFWLVSVTPVGYPLLAVYLGAFTALTVYILATMRRAFPRVPMAVLAPAAWLAVEFVRGEIFLSGYAWFLLAHPLIGLPMLALPAGVLGAYFVSALAAALCGSVVDIIDAGAGSQWRGRAVVALVLVLVAWTGTAIVGGGVRPASSREAVVRIGVVQTNVPQGNKLNWTAERMAADFRRFIDLTRELAAAEPRPDVIVWPETMFPGVSLNPRAVEAFESVFRANNPQYGPDDRSLNGAMVKVLLDTQREMGIPLFVGSKEIIGATMVKDPDGRARLDDDARHNSVVVINEGRVLDERYDKVELVPFGEFIPVAWRWPALQRLVLDVGAGGMMFDLSPSTREVSLEIPGSTGPDERPVRAATPICFEVTRSALCRRLARDADLLINVSNDGWFGDYTSVPVPSDAGRAQHLLAARWRCVELGMPMVRAVNTGLSGAIGSTGRLLPLTPIVAAAAPTRADGAFIATVRLGEYDGSIFGRVGNVFGWTAMCVGWLLFAAAWIRNRRGGASPPGSLSR